MSVELLRPEEKKSLLHSAGLLLRDISNCNPVSGGWNLRESVWPALDLKRSPSATVAPELVLLPLSRLGAPAGFSGATVVIGYFTDRQAGSTLFPSRPMVIKLYKPEVPTNDKLLDESNRGDRVKPFVAYSRDAFAQPLCLHPAGADLPCSVLWSPFASSEWIWQDYAADPERKLHLAIMDLNRLLTEDMVYNPSSVVKATFQLLVPFHLRAGLRQRPRLNIVHEYHDYLRGLYLDEPHRSLWLTAWRSVWGHESEETIHAFGRDWANPLWVVHTLRSLEVELCCGAIHGDLHPRNVVISQGGTPQIIDFGWASDFAHIAKDFVLMECNLRFMNLRSDLPSSFVEQLAQWIRFQQPSPPDLAGSLPSTIGLIQCVRDCALQAFAGLPDVDWDLEYVVPLFLTSMGLIRYLGNASNQESAKLSVLALAQYIKTEVLPPYHGASSRKVQP